MACAIWRVQDLVVEDREVEGQAETDRVSGSKLGLRDIGSVLGVVSVDILSSMSYECDIPCRPHARQ